MEIILLTAWLTAVIASPLDLAPTPASMTTREAGTTTATETKTADANVGNLCIGVPLSDVHSVAAVPTASLGDLLSLGKLQECAGNTPSNQPLTGLLGLLGGRG
ncbi:hypothetical protein BJX63DRAFT_430028 [Aspergillus granulosus]|uniref:Secreted protein n=1 Tax=Aspergillus granulosus TaxID=176169 RepID=A0ABR4HNB8_9EURO